METQMTLHPANSLPLHSLPAQDRPSLFGVD
jgi:hypothetical protein